MLSLKHVINISIDEIITKIQQNKNPQYSKSASISFPNETSDSVFNLGFFPKHKLSKKSIFSKFYLFEKNTKNINMKKYLYQPNKKQNTNNEIKSMIDYSYRKETRIFSIFPYLK